jgi:hypothetical protein
MAEAQAIVHSAGTTTDADHQARSHTEQVLQAFFKSIDWNVQVRWRYALATLDNADTD